MEKPRSLSSPENQNMWSLRSHHLTIVGWRPQGHLQVRWASTPSASLYILVQPTEPVEEGQPFPSALDPEVPATTSASQEGDFE